MQRCSPQKLSISLGPPKLGLTQTGVTDLPLLTPSNPPMSPLKSSPWNFSANYPPPPSFPPWNFSLSLSLTLALSLPLLLSPAPAHKASICLQPQHPWPFVPSAGASESTHGRPQPLRTPRLVQGQELLTKAQCGNEGCVEGGEGVSRGDAALRQMAREVYQLLHGGCQFRFTTTNETHRGRTSEGMPTEIWSYCTFK